MTFTVTRQPAFFLFVFVSQHKGPVEPVSGPADRRPDGQTKASLAPLTYILPPTHSTHSANTLQLERGLLQERQAHQIKMGGSMSADVCIHVCVCVCECVYVSVCVSLCVCFENNTQEEIRYPSE